MDIIFVNRAQPYKSWNMGTRGKAKNMLISQFNFPLSYDNDKDKITSAYLDRVETNVSEKCFEKYRLNMHNIERFFENCEPEIVLNFISDILQLELTNCTGYRILGTVGGDGYPYYYLQLFSKHLETTTEVYSGFIAPNVMD